jgi:ubiquinone/menaquinone biosynthesis C-methylase UbiE
MTIADAIHGGFVYPRRVRALVDHAVRLIPPDAHVLDVGSGDGHLAAAVLDRRPDLRIQGLDVLVRPDTAIDVAPFDGRSIPMAAKSVDVVTFFDVLHHASDPKALLREAGRVARSCIVIKDHVCDNALARVILRFMDDVGNKRFGVALPHNYWSARQWVETTAELRLDRTVWEVGGLGLYPMPASLVFGGRLHLLARLEVPVSRDRVLT